MSKVPFRKPLIAACEELIDGFLDPQKVWASRQRPLGPIRGLAAGHARLPGNIPRKLLAWCRPARTENSRGIGKGGPGRAQQEWIRRHPRARSLFPLASAATWG